MRNLERDRRTGGARLDASQLPSKPFVNLETAFLTRGAHKRRQPSEWSVRSARIYDKANIGRRAGRASDNRRSAFTDGRLLGRTPQGGTACRDRWGADRDSRRVRTIPPQPRRTGIVAPHYRPGGNSRAAGNENEIDAQSNYRIDFTSPSAPPLRAVPLGRREQTGPSRAVLSHQRHFSSPRSIARPSKPPPAAPMIVPTVRSRPPSSSRPTRAPTAAPMISPVVPFSRRQW